MSTSFTYPDSIGDAPKLQVNILNKSKQLQSFSHPRVSISRKWEIGNFVCCQVHHSFNQKDIFQLNYVPLLKHIQILNLGTTWEFVFTMNFILFTDMQEQFLNAWLSSRLKLSICTTRLSLFSISTFKCVCIAAVNYYRNSTDDCALRD